MDSDYEEKLLKHIFKAFFNATREKYKEEDKNVIHVHELISCKYKSEFAKELPELFTPIRPPILIGEAIDEYLKKLFERDSELSAITETTEGEYKKELKVDGEKILLVGRPDIVLKDLVVEIKYSQFENDLPREHHIAQLKIYLFLTNKPKGKLIYVTNKQLKEFDIEEAWTEEDIIKLFQSWSSPRYEWECTYCVIRAICPYYKKPQTINEEETSESIERKNVIDKES